MLNHLYRCIYVHIPKTGGNSVNRAFGVGWEDHKDLQSYAADLGEVTFAQYYKFAIVRNPWDRMLSDYNYQLKKSRAKISKLFLFTNTGKKRRFGEWVRTALSDPHRYAPSAWGGDVGPNIHRWSPQVDWISLNGRIAVNRILRLEHLQEGFNDVCRDLGCPIVRLPRCNRRLHWHYSWYYDDETRELIASTYARDIEAFGYEFVSRKPRFWNSARRRVVSMANLTPA